MTNCPIAPAERRLRDAFHHWKQIEQEYFNPDRFRIALNSFLQEARNVTFILQKGKSKIPEFDGWYARWQNTMRDDHILRWAIESRNRITKVGDLETKSQCHVIYTSGWTDDLTQQFRINPTAPTHAIVAHVLKHASPEMNGEESLICIERRWVDKNLSDLEILQAASHILLVLSDLIRDAHLQILSKTLPDLKCELSSKLKHFRDTYPLELANLDDNRKVWIQTDSGEKIKYDVTASVVNQKDIETFTDEVALHYGLVNIKKHPDNEQPSLPAAIAIYSEVAQKMLEKDGHLRSFFFALDSDSHKLYQISLVMRTRAEKHLAIRRAALLLENCNIAWAILVGESWLTTIDPTKPICHARDSPTRKECLSLNAVSAVGEFKNKHIPFERRNGKIVFKDGFEDNGRSNIMLPILTALQRKSKSSIIG